MQPFPHRYEVEARATVTGDITVASDGLPDLKSSAPPAFGGPSDRWSPETLLVAAVADCFALTFRALATMTRLPWTALTCDAVGTVERVEHVPCFTAFTVHARLEIPDGTNQQKARQLLERTEQSCLINNSLKAPVHLLVDVHMKRPAA